MTESERAETWRLYREAVAKEYPAAPQPAAYYCHRCRRMHERCGGDAP